MMIINPYRFGGGAFNLTANVWQDFEFGSDGDNPTAGNLDGTHSGYTLSWTLNGTTSLNYVRTAASHTSPSTINSITDSGTRGLEIDINGANTASRAYYAAINQAATPVSYGFWIYPTSLVNNVAVVHQLFQVLNSGFSHQFRINMGSDGSGNLKINITASTTSADLTLTKDAWHYVAFKGTKNSTVFLEVFDASGTSEGSTTATAFDREAYYVVIGGFNAYSEIGSIYMDNLVIDWTDATHPLKPWA
jgi:hypothetical protein